VFHMGQHIQHIQWITHSTTFRSSGGSSHLLRRYARIVVFTLGLDELQQLLRGDPAGGVPVQVPQVPGQLAHHRVLLLPHPRTPAPAAAAAAVALFVPVPAQSVRTNLQKLLTTQSAEWRVARVYVSACERMLECSA